MLSQAAHAAALFCSLHGFWKSSRWRCVGGAGKVQLLSPLRAQVPLAPLLNSVLSMSCHWPAALPSTEMSAVNFQRRQPFETPTSAEAPFLVSQFALLTSPFSISPLYLYQHATVSPLVAALSAENAASTAIGFHLIVLGLPLASFVGGARGRFP